MLGMEHLAILVILVIWDIGLSLACFLPKRDLDLLIILHILGVLPPVQGLVALKVQFGQLKLKKLNRLFFQVLRLLFGCNLKGEVGYLE